MLVLQNAIRLFSGPDFTKETLEAFGLIVEDLRAGKVTLPKAVARAEKLGPSFGKEFREWVSLGANIVIAMGTVAAAVIGYLALDRSNRTLEDVAVEAFEQTYVEPQLDVRPKLTWQNHLSRPEAAHSDFVPSTSNGLNRKHRRAAAAKKKNKK